ncbi:hypothetical protein HK104_004168 [Borealophlyctis nickersoniae]|nr:hypothetical protein HK104_004168 [Borealophlyctis nickersoniae]
MRKHLDWEPEVPATTPSMLASFIRIEKDEKLHTEVNAASQLYYVIRGAGKTITTYEIIEWQKGDLFVLPSTISRVTHKLRKDDPEFGGAALMWVHDAPLFEYLGATATAETFEPAIIQRKAIEDCVNDLRHDVEAHERGRLGIIFGNELTQQTKTVTHSLSAIMTVLPPGTDQTPHRHNAASIAHVVSAAENEEGAPFKVFTRMAKEVDEKGRMVNPVNVEWEAGGMFIIPPGYWHSNHNESSEEAWLFSVQDGGLHTHLRTMDLRTARGEVERLKAGHVRSIVP